MRTSFKFSSLLFLSLFISAFIAGCNKASYPVGPTQDENLSNGRISVTNNAATLALRVHYYANTDVSLDTTVLRKSTGLSNVAAQFRLKLRAEVSPPVSGGTILQATHIAISGNYAYVSYNLQGSSYLGGVDVFDVSQKNNPILISQAIFQTTDVSAISYSNGKVYLAEATSDTQFVYPAVIEEITLLNNKLTLTSRRVGVPSYVATDVKVSGGKVFATSGSGGAGIGGLTTIDLNTFLTVSTDPFLDARSVDIYGTSMVVMEGTPARLRVYATANNQLLSNYTVGGATIPESKSVVAVILDRAFVAAGDAGAKVVSLANGAVTDSIPRAIVSGLDPSVTVTNAVSVNQDLLLLANGEAGVYVAQATVNMETTPTVSTNLNLLGKMQFGSAESANFVASANNIIFIATGLGGLKIVEVQY